MFIDFIKANDCAYLKTLNEEFKKTKYVKELEAFYTLCKALLEL